MQPDYPFITPRGFMRATFTDIPAFSTISTTSLTSLYASDTSSLRVSRPVHLTNIPRSDSSLDTERPCVNFMAAVLERSLPAPWQDAFTGCPGGRSSHRLPELFRLGHGDVLRSRGGAGTPRTRRRTPAGADGAPVVPHLAEGMFLGARLN